MGFVAEKAFCYSHSFGILQILPNKSMSRYNRRAIMSKWRLVETKLVSAFLTSKSCHLSEF